MSDNHTFEKLERSVHASHFIRRVAIVAVAAIGTLVLAPVLEGIAGWGHFELTRARAVWWMLSLEVPAAVYVWGVGALSRYTAPPEDVMQPRGESPRTTSVSAADGRN